MNIISGYVCAGENAGRKDAVVLQQLKKPSGAVFACVCSGSRPAPEEMAPAGYMAGRLQHWFMERRGSHWQEAAGCMAAIGEEMAAYSRRRNIVYEADCAAVIISGSRFLLLQKGRGEIYLLNRVVLAPRIRLLSGGSAGSSRETVIQEGELEAGVGLLLSTAAFTLGMEREELSSCLAINELWREEQIGRRLQELQGEARSRNRGRTGSAVLICTLKGETDAGRG